MKTRAGRPPGPPDAPPAGRLWLLLVVAAVFFVLPLALFVRVVVGGGQARLAAMTLMLTLPPTGALILQLNPDLLPDRAALAALSRLDLATLGALAVLLAGGVWWVSGLAAGR